MTNLETNDRIGSKEYDNRVTPSFCKQLLVERIKTKEMKLLLHPEHFNQYLRRYLRSTNKYTYIDARYFSRDKENRESGVKFRKENKNQKPVKKSSDDGISAPTSPSISQNSILENNNDVQTEKVGHVDSQQKAIFATKIGAFANVSLAVSKGIIGLSISSTALVADSVNSMGDVVGDAVVYYTVKEARKRATPDRPWGLGKLEPLGNPHLLSSYFYSLKVIYFEFRCSNGG